MALEVVEHNVFKPAAIAYGEETRSAGKVINQNYREGGNWGKIPTVKRVHRALNDGK